MKALDTCGVTVSGIQMRLAPTFTTIRKARPPTTKVKNMAMKMMAVSMVKIRTHKISSSKITEVLNPNRALWLLEAIIDCLVGRP